MRPRIIAFLLCAASAFGATFHSTAGTCASPADWAMAGSWLENSVPGAADDVIIQNTNGIVCSGSCSARTVVQNSGANCLKNNGTMTVGASHAGNSWTTGAGATFTNNGTFSVGNSPACTFSQTATISTTSRTANVTTVTTNTAHGLQANQYIHITGVADGTFNGYFSVITASGSTFTYTNTGSNGTASGGTVTGGVCTNGTEPNTIVMTVAGTGATFIQNGTANIYGSVALNTNAWMWPQAGSLTTLESNNGYVYEITSTVGTPGANQSWIDATQGSNPATALSHATITAPPLQSFAIGGGWTTYFHPLGIVFSYLTLGTPTTGGATNPTATEGKCGTATTLCTEVASVKCRNTVLLQTGTLQIGQGLQATDNIDWDWLDSAHPTSGCHGRQPLSAGNWLVVPQGAAPVPSGGALRTIAHSTFDTNTAYLNTPGTNQAGAGTISISDPNFNVHDNIFTDIFTAQGTFATNLTFTNNAGLKRNWNRTTPYLSFLSSSGAVISNLTLFSPPSLLFPLIGDNPHWLGELESVISGTGQGSTLQCNQYNNVILDAGGVPSGKDAAGDAISPHSSCSRAKDWIIAHMFGNTGEGGGGIPNSPWLFGGDMGKAHWTIFDDVTIASSNTVNVLYEDIGNAAMSPWKADLWRANLVDTTLNMVTYGSGQNNDTVPYQAARTPVLGVSCTATTCTVTMASNPFPTAGQLVYFGRCVGDFSEAPLTSATFLNACAMYAISNPTATTFDFALAGHSGNYQEGLGTVSTGSNWMEQRDYASFHISSIAIDSAGRILTVTGTQNNTYPIVENDRVRLGSSMIAADLLTNAPWLNYQMVQVCNSTDGTGCTADPTSTSFQALVPTAPHPWLAHAGYSGPETGLAETGFYYDYNSFSNRGTPETTCGANFWNPAKGSAGTLAGGNPAKGCTGALGGTAMATCNGATCTTTGLVGMAIGQWVSYDTVPAIKAPITNIVGSTLTLGTANTGATGLTGSGMLRATRNYWQHGAYGSGTGYGANETLTGNSPNFQGVSTHTDCNAAQWDVLLGGTPSTYLAQLNDAIDQIMLNASGFDINGNPATARSPLYTVSNFRAYMLECLRPTNQAFASIKDVDGTDMGYTGTVVDSQGTFHAGGFTVSPALAITTASLPNGTLGTPYSQILTSAGYVGPPTWSVAGGSLSPLALSSAGAISGTPTSAGTLSFTARVTDGVNTTTQALSIAIQPNTSSVQRERSASWY